MALYSTVLYSTLLNATELLYCTLLYWTLLYCTVTEPYSTLLYSTLLYWTGTVLCWTVTLLNCDFIELWLYWTVTLLNCDFIELWLYFTELELYWDVVRISEVSQALDKHRKQRPARGIGTMALSSLRFVWATLWWCMCSKPMTTHPQKNFAAVPAPSIGLLRNPFPVSLSKSSHNPRAIVRLATKRPSLAQPWTLPVTSIQSAAGTEFK